MIMITGEGEREKERGRCALVAEEDLLAIYIAKADGTALKVLAQEEIPSDRSQ
jgi:hypothetical protein